MLAITQCPALTAADEVEPVGAANRLARDGFSYLHLPMKAAIVLVGLGMESTLAHVGDPLRWEPAAGPGGGGAPYLLAPVAFKLRPRHLQRSPAGRAPLLLAFVPVAHWVESLVTVTVGVVASVLSATIGLEAARHAEARRAVREAEHLRPSGD